MLFFVRWHYRGSREKRVGGTLGQYVVALGGNCGGGTERAVPGVFGCSNQIRNTKFPRN